MAAENEEIAKIYLFRVFGQGADKTAKFEKKPAGADFFALTHDPRSSNIFSDAMVDIRRRVVRVGRQDFKRLHPIYNERPFKLHYSDSLLECLCPLALSDESSFCALPPPSCFFGPRGMLALDSDCRTPNLLR